MEASSALIDGATAFEVSGLDLFAVFTHLDDEILNCLESFFFRDFSFVVCLLFRLCHCLSLLC